MSKANQISGNDVRVLIADDFEMIRLMLKTGLQQLGISEIDEAVNGTQTLIKMREAVKAGKPHTFVFVDWLMPEKDGLEVLKECQSDPALAKIPFVMVTAESEQAKVILALKTGAADYIVKPISPAILQKKVLRLMMLNQVA